jgi:peptidoglycan L-alanyl-D-glutamate endopeptidase CwlK
MGMLKHEEKLGGVNPELVNAIKLGVSRLGFDCVASEGLRSKEQMRVNWGKGRTSTQCIACGIDPKYAKPGLSKVTWLADPFNSKHGKGEAVDIYPLVDGKLATVHANLPLFRAMYDAVMGAAREEGVSLRYGGNWDRDSSLFETGEDDAVHFEVISAAKVGSDLKSSVLNRGVPSDEFLTELIAWGRSAPDAIFAKNDRYDIYSSVKKQLGPYKSIAYRRAVMLEVMRVLAGFESSWKWNEGRDTTIRIRTARHHRSRRMAGQRGLDGLGRGPDCLGGQVDRHQGRKRIPERDEIQSSAGDGICCAAAAPYSHRSRPREAR